MALFSECSLEYASKLLDTADIVREAIFRQRSCNAMRLRNSIFALPLERRNLRSAA